MDLEKVKLFYAVAKTGKFTTAATELNITQPALSRSIQLLEYSLNTKLLERSYKGVMLTSSGERLYEFAKQFIDESEIIKRQISDHSDEPAGEIKILTTPGMASIWLCELIPGFLKQYPDISLDIRAEVSDLDKNISQSDIIIRTYINHHPNLIQIPILSSHNQLWASEEYLKEFGRPKKIEDLDNHRLIVYEKLNINNLANTSWILEKGRNKNKPRQPYLIINSLDGLITCARNGLGIIGLPKELVDLRNEDHRLINPIEGLDGPIVDIYCIYSEKMKKSRKINLFIDYINKLNFINCNH